MILEVVQENSGQVHLEPLLSPTYLKWSPTRFRTVTNITIRILKVTKRNSLFLEKSLAQVGVHSFGVLSVPDPSRFSHRQVYNEDNFKSDKTNVPDFTRNKKSPS
jgi:hypothetical protein